MHDFFETDFVISDIRLCVKVREETGTSVHKNRSSHGLVCFTEGESLFEFDDRQSICVKAGQIIYLPKFSNYNSTDAPGAVCIAVNFDLSDKALTFAPFITQGHLGSKYTTYFEKILNQWTGQAVGYKSGCLGILYTIISHLHQDRKQEYQSSAHTRLLETGVDYINRHITDPALTVEEVAQRAGISPEYLRKLFRAKYGVAPREYILNKRLDRAKAMLECGDIRLGNIPFECGFSEYSYFARVFKRRLGISPHHYLKQITEEHPS